MLNAYKRHSPNCPHRHEGRKYRRCKCRLWVDGFLNGEEIRESLKTRSWDEAQEIIREWETAGRRDTERGSDTNPVAVSQACNEFLADAEARKLREPTLYKYHLLFRRLKAFAESEGIRYIGEFDLATVRKFRAT